MGNSDFTLESILLLESDITDKGRGRPWGLFSCSEVPNLVFSTTYLRGSSTPSAFPRLHRGLRFPPLISGEKDGGLPPVTFEKA